MDEKNFVCSFEGTCEIKMLNGSFGCCSAFFLYTKRYEKV